MIVKEDGVVASAPLNTTAGVEGPKKPIKFQSVPGTVLKRAAKLKTKKAVQEQLNIIADVLTSDDNKQAVFLE